MALVYNLFKKDKQESEIGLPKISTNSLEIKIEGVVGDYNHFRNKKREKRGEEVYLNKAVLIMPHEMIDQLNEEGWPVKPGDLGENITTHGRDYEDFRSGERYKIRDSILEITGPCIPCAKLSNLPYVGKEKISQFIEVLLDRRGWYAKVLKEGIIRVNDGIKIIK